MKAFMDENFLLSTETAQKLYHEHAAKMPIVDYHCHISPKEVYEDRHFDNITQVWLGGDHYKWLRHALQRRGRILHHRRRVRP